MSVSKFTTLSGVLLVFFAAIYASCDLDNNYDERTVVYVSNINDGYPYFADVLNQGDSVYYDRDDGALIFKYIDDYVMEDWVKVQFHNRPYNSTVTPTGSLCDFLVTEYTVEFIRLDGGAQLVTPFTGNMSLLVPANSLVEAYVLLVPYLAKVSGAELSALQYSSNEIMTNALITFRGHEVQTDRFIEFSAGLQVNFLDYLGTDDPNEH